MTARTRQFYYVDTLTSTLLDGDSICQTLRIICQYNPSHQCGPSSKGQTMTRRHRLAYVQSGSVSTGTGFRSVAKPDLHSAMLVVKRTNKHCWDCYVLERDRFGGGSFVVWGWKNGWPEDVLCCHARQFQCIISTTSCDHFSIIYTHKKLKWYLEIKTKQKSYWIQCIFFVCFKFPERCGYFELKRNKRDVPIYGSMFSRRK